MSRIGIKPIPVPSGVQVTIGDGNAVTVKGPKGELSHTFSRRVSIAQESSEVKVARSSEDRESRSLHGLSRALLNNMVVGVKDGFTKNLEIQGVGYRAAMEGSTLVLNVGYSHQVRIQPADGISFVVTGTNQIAVSGINKQVVGEEAARIRGVRPPEPYKGKGIRYAGEAVRRKAGKAGKK